MKVLRQIGQVCLGLLLLLLLVLSVVLLLLLVLLLALLLLLLLLWPRDDCLQLAGGYCGWILFNGVVAFVVLIVFCVVAETGAAEWAVRKAWCDIDDDDEARMAFSELAELAIPSICK